MSIYAQRLASQIEFIKQCALMKKAPTQDFAKHSDFTCTEEQLLGLPGINLNITDDNPTDGCHSLSKKSEGHNSNNKLRRIGIVR